MRNRDIRWMTGLAVALAAAAMVFGLNSHASAQAGAARDGVFIHVSHGAEDPHRVLMALQMAAIMSESRDVLVYFDIHGVDAVLKDADSLAYSHFPGSHEQLDRLAEAGVKLFVCPGCLKAAGKSPADVREGVAIADKDAFFDFTSGRILTLDY